MYGKITDRRRNARLVGQVLGQGNLREAHHMAFAVGNDTGNRTAYDIRAPERGAMAQLDDRVWSQRRR